MPKSTHQNLSGRGQCMNVIFLSTLIWFFLTQYDSWHSLLHSRFAIDIERRISKSRLICDASPHTPVYPPSSFLHLTLTVPCGNFFFPLFWRPLSWDDVSQLLTPAMQIWKSYRHLAANPLFTDLVVDIFVHDCVLLPPLSTSSPHSTLTTDINFKFRSILMSRLSAHIQFCSEKHTLNYILTSAKTLRFLRWKT